ncbi:MAG TPA: hypothetical protein VGP72_22115 [Planctomycetota bacterium]|jgi:hypothetical protein
MSAYLVDSFTSANSRAISGVRAYRMPELFVFHLHVTFKRRGAGGHGGPPHSRGNTRGRARRNTYVYEVLYADMDKYYFRWKNALSKGRFYRGVFKPHYDYVSKY